MKILLGDFSAKVGREDTFKPTIGNEGAHEISIYNGVRVVNCATSGNLRVKRTMLVPGPSHLEVEIAIAKLKKYESSGSDQIPKVPIQAGGETLLSAIY
jgi:hypothetical protein